MFVNFIKKSSWLVVTGITLIILGVMVNLNISPIGKVNLLLSDNINVFLYIFLSLFIGLLLYRIKNNKYFLLALFLTALIIRVIWVLNIHSLPVSDFMQMYNGAQDILNGNIDALRGSEYFQTWVYQLGFTFFQYVIINIFGNSIGVLKLVNAIITSCIPIVIYLICNTLKKGKSARVPALIYCFYVTSIAMTSVLTNQHLSTLLIYFGLYLLISKEKYFFSIIYVGVIISLGNIIRPEGIIVIIAIVLFLIFNDFENIKNPKRFLKYNILRPTLIVAIYLITSTMVSGAFKLSGYTDYSLSNREPYWKFVVGLNDKHGGLWNSEDGDLVNRYPLGEKRDDYEKQLILDRLKDKEKVINLFNKKFRYMWTKNDFGSLSFSLNYKGASKHLMKLLLKIEKVQFIIIVSLAFLSVIISVFKRIKFGYYHLFMIILIGYVLSHLILEVQTRYRYFIIPTLVILSIEAISSMNKYRNNYD